MTTQSQSNVGLRWPTLTSIYAGICAGLPSILIGNTLYNSYGLKGSVLSLLLGFSILFALTVIFSLKGLEKRMPFIDLVQYYLGDFGAKIAGFSFIISLTGWFALQLEFMVKSAQTLFPNVPYEIFATALGVFILLSVINNLKGMGKISNFLLPFILAVMLLLFFKICDSSQSFKPSSFNLYGIPLIVSSLIAGVLDAPTYLYQGKDKKSVITACAIILLGVAPFMGLIGIFFSAFSGNADFIKTVSGLGGSIWKIGMAAFIIACGWITNNLNLFSVAISAKTIWTTWSFAKRVIVFGVLGTTLSFFKGLESLESFLSFIGILESAVGATLLIFFFGERSSERPLLSKRMYKKFYSVIFASSAFGILSQAKLVYLTGYGFLDTFLLSATINAILFIYEQRNVKYVTRNL